MRPLELRLRNFRSYFGDGHVFDFRDRHLVGIVGPIGSGKSTILDAIAFALYGRTPRVSRSTKSLIHQRADHAAVALRFEIDGQIWEAVRQLRSKGQSQHALYLLEKDAPDPETTSEKIVLEGEVNERIEALLGFDYDAFGRSVMLAQGKFAEFLNARPADRDKVLKGVFGHEKIDAMRELAKAKGKEVEHEVEKIAIRLEHVEAATGRIAGRRERLERLTTRLEALGSITERHDELSETLETTRIRVTEATARMSELTKLAEKLPDSDRSEEIIATAERSGAKRTELAEKLSQAHEQAAAAEAHVKSDAFVERSQRLKTASELIVRLESQSAAATQARAQVSDAAALLASSEKQVETVQEDVERTSRHLESVTSESQTVGETVMAAETAVLEARHADMAAALRVGLEAGDACPVCEQPVHELPSTSGTEDVEEAEERLVAARAERESVEGRLRDATASAESARTALDAARTRLEETNKALAKAESAATEAVSVSESTRENVVGLLGDGDPAALLEQERVALDELGERVEAARKRVEDVRRQLDDAITMQQESQRSLGDVRTQVVALASQLDRDTDLPEDDPAALRAALAQLRDDWASSMATLTEQQEADRAAEVLVAGQLAELSEHYELQGSLAETTAAVRAEVGVMETEITADEQLIGSAQDLVDERDALAATAGSYRRLASDLTDSRFIRYLLDEERAALAELGSDHFQRLSSGRYRFSDDGTFEVIDLTAADAVRKADSLSGGETFLASLGLALGLAEMVSRSGGRLDAFFLDEGFGSLDSEHLDLAMEGIEALVTDHLSRLVVVVSHVPELRHRIEDLIVLDKDPVTGDSVIVSGATS